jgi:hypothetical protein
MRLEWLALGGGCLVLLLATQCGMKKDPTTAMGASMTVIHFPQPWSKAGPNGERIILTPPQTFVIRRTSNSSGGELLFAVQDSSGSLSQNFYAVSLDGKFSVRPITVQAWGQAEMVSMTAGERLSRDATTVTADLANYNGKAFARTGSFWSEPIALTSSRREWLAVFSYASKERVEKNAGTDISKFIGGGEPASGDLFVDIYNTFSGEKVLNGSAPFAGVGPSLLFSQASWTEGGFFVMPLDSLSQTCFLGIPGGQTNRR